VTKFVCVTSLIKKKQLHSSFYSTIDKSIGTFPAELTAPDTTSPNFSKRNSSISNICLRRGPNKFANKIEQAEGKTQLQARGSSKF